MSPFLRTRLPARTEVRQLLGLVAFLVFSWTIAGFLYQLPSLRMFMSLGSVLASLSYRLAFALVETTMVIAALIALSALLPPAALARGFSYKGFLIVVTATVASLLFEQYYTIGSLLYPGSAPYQLAIAFTGLSCLMLSVLLLLVHIDPGLRRPILLAVDRTSVFAYVYLPLGVLSLIVVAVRVLR